MQNTLQLNHFKMIIQFRQKNAFKLRLSGQAHSHLRAQLLKISVFCYFESQLIQGIAYILNIKDNKSNKSFTFAFTKSKNLSVRTKSEAFYNHFIFTWLYMLNIERSPLSAFAPNEDDNRWIGFFLRTTKCRIL